MAAVDDSVAAVCSAHPSWAADITRWQHHRIGPLGELGSWRACRVGCWLHTAVHLWRVAAAWETLRQRKLRAALDVMRGDGGLETATSWRLLLASWSRWKVFMHGAAVLDEAQNSVQRAFERSRRDADARTSGVADVAGAAAAAMKTSVRASEVKVARAHGHVLGWLLRAGAGGGLGRLDQ